MTHAAIRINARLTGEDARRFQELQAQGKNTVTEVIRESVKERHARLIKPRKSAYEIMKASGFIGSGKGSPDSSSEQNIRRTMNDVMRAKYPQHHRDKS